MPNNETDSEPITITGINDARGRGLEFGVWLGAMAGVQAQLPSLLRERGFMIALFHHLLVEKIREGDDVVLA